MKRIVPFLVILPVAAIAVLLFVAIASQLPDSSKPYTEQLVVRIAGPSELERFNLTGGVVGYALGRRSLLWGMAGGMLAAKGCQVPIVIEGKVAVIKKAKPPICGTPSGGTLQIVMHSCRLYRKGNMVGYGYINYATPDGTPLEVEFQ